MIVRAAIWAVLSAAGAGAAPPPGAVPSPGPSAPAPVPAPALTVSRPLPAAEPARAAAPGEAQLAEHMTLEATLALFAAHGFELLLQDAEVQGAEGDARAAAAWLNPQVAGAMSWAGRPYTATLCPAGQCSVRGGSVTLGDGGGAFDLLMGKYGLRRRQGIEALAAARAGRSDARRLLEAEVKRQYLAVSLGQARLVFAQQSAQTFAEGLALFADRYRAGDISEADLARVQVATLEAEQGVDVAADALQDDRQALALLVGVRGPVPAFTVAPPWPSEARAQGLIEVPEATLVQLARTARPDLLAGRHMLHQADAALRAAERSRLPDVALSFNYQQFGIGQNAIQPRTYTGGLSLELPLFDQRQGQVLRARAGRRRAEVAVRRLEAGVDSDVRRAHAGLRHAYGRLVRSRDALHVRSARALELVRLQYAKGAASLLDLLDAQRTFIAVNGAYFDHLGQFWGAIVGLEQAVATEVQP